MNIVTIGCKLNLSCNSVIELVQFFCDFFLMGLWSVIGNKDFFREESHIIYQELCNGKSIFTVAYYCKTLSKNTGFQKGVGKAFNVIVELCFLFGNYAFCKLLVCPCKLLNCPKELSSLTCANRQNRILQKLDSKTAFKIFCTFKTCPWRNKNCKFCIRNLFKIVQAPAKAKDCIWFKTNCLQKTFNFAKVSKPVRILLRWSHKKIYKAFFLTRGP